MAMTRDELRAEVLKAATFHGDEGTSGYLLSDAQVDAIMAATARYAGLDPQGHGDGGSARIRVTAFDLGTGESNSVVIEDDYVLICAGTCHRHYVEDHFDGTHVVTVKGRKQGRERKAPGA